MSHRPDRKARSAEAQQDSSSPKWPGTAWRAGLFSLATGLWRSIKLSLNQERLREVEKGREAAEIRRTTTPVSFLSCLRLCSYFRSYKACTGQVDLGDVKWVVYSAV